jgi:dihydroorotate dehydrogenase
MDLKGKIGIAAGVDKDGKCIESLLARGFDFVEIGSVTVWPQRGNEDRTIWLHDQSIHNRQGCPSEGMKSVKARLQEFRATHPGAVVGVNAIKMRNTPIELCAEEYITLFDTFASVASFFVINISSPNVPDLKEMLVGNRLFHLCAQLKQQQTAHARETSQYVPIFVKIPAFVAFGPDQVEIANAVDKIDGVIVGNSFPVPFQEHEQLGLSGKPLFELMLASVKAMRFWLPRHTIVACGGIFDREDAQKALKAGATCVEMCSAVLLNKSRL